MDETSKLLITFRKIQDFVEKKGGVSVKKIRTQEAIGHVICHDITVIIKDEKKGVAFQKGHVVTEEDIPKLLSLGKDHLYVWEKDESMMHENEAAEILAGICSNEGIKRSDVKEGKIELSADIDGLFQVDVERLDKINELEQIMIATIHTNRAVKKGEKLAGTRIIPLVIEKEKMEQVIKLAGRDPLLKVIPYKRKTAGIVTTGNEVFYKRIQDTFTPVVKDKLKEYGIEVKEHITVPDKKEEIVDAIRIMKEKGLDMIVCTGGMSVDPDDMTPGAICESGADIVTYGAPVLPGAMFLLGYFADGTPIMGLPGCVMYAKATIFDLILPRAAADVKVRKKEIEKMGHGGLCLNCNICHYPNCNFGKRI